MKKYLFTIIIGLLPFYHSYGQVLRQLVAYENMKSIGISLYNSDSLMYGYYHDNSGNIVNLVYNGNTWKPSNLKDGIIYTAPNSKVYYLEKKSISEINPKTQTKVKSYSINLKYLPYFFTVFKDSFFIAYGNNSDTSFYKYNFNEKKISSNFFLKHIFLEDAKLVSDSILFLKAQGTLYRKNINSGSLTKLLIYSSLTNYVCEENKLAILDNNNHIFISTDYGNTFKDIDISKYKGFFPLSMHISKSGINMLAYSYSLVTFDFSGIEQSKINVEPIFKNLITYTACSHEGYTIDKVNWINDSTWLIGDGDIYKIYPFKNNKIKYLGGSFNLGVNKTFFNNQGNQLFFETGNGLWSFSNDTGKTWKIPEMTMKQSVQNAVIFDSSVFILHENKLHVYHFGHRFSPAFFRL